MTLPIDDNRNEANEPQPAKAAPLSSKMALSMAHQLSNPITAIIGFADALLGRLDTSMNIDRDELTQYLQVISKEAHRSRKLIEEYSNYLRMKESSGCE